MGRIKLKMIHLVNKLVVLLILPPCQDVHEFNLPFVSTEGRSSFFYNVRISCDPTVWEIKNDQEGITLLTNCPLPPTPSVETPRNTYCRCREGIQMYPFSLHEGDPESLGA